MSTPPPAPPATGAHVLQADGALDAEHALLQRLDALLDVPGPLAGRLAIPIRVVVASRSQRLHVVERLLRHRGRAVLGVEVQSLVGLANQLLASLGRPRHLADALLPVLVARRVVEVEPLASLLSPLEDGPAAAARPVGDLLDAGFDGAFDALPLAELLWGLDAGEDLRRRAIALVQVAARVQADIEALDLVRGSDLLRQAAALLEREPARLHASAVLVHGLVDPSPAERRLVEALVRQGAEVILAVPRAAAERVRGRADAAPVSPLALGLAGARPVHRVDAPTDAPRLDLAAAPGRRAEARHLARRLRRLLDQGVPPERVGVVVRETATWGGILRPELERLGVPLSGVGAQAPAGLAHRKLRALLTVLARGGRASTDRWLDALGRLPGAGRVELEDLRLGLRALGLARLGEVAALDVDAALGGRSGLPLPTRSAIVVDADPGPPDAPEEQVFVQRRRLPGVALQAARDAAARLLDGLGAAETLGLRAWSDRLRGLAQEALGWGDPESAWRALGAALDGLVRRVGVDVQLSEAELHLVLGPSLLAAAAGPLGGAGGGVQLLSAIEARGRTFDHLFVLGLTRGELPAGARPDPLLPDELRVPLRTLLPDLATTAGRREVERALLDHLLASAPDLHLSWPATDDDGRVRPPSPAVEQLRLACPELPVVRVCAPGSLADLPVDAGPRPPSEHLLLAGLAGADGGAGADRWVHVLLDQGCDPSRAARAAAGIQGVLAELDAPPGSRGVGPYLGFVGPVGAGDPRRDDVAVTTLERVAACGWHAFLALVLRVEPPPAPGQSMPGVDARLVGLVVHEVLEEIARGALADGPGARSLDEVRARRGCVAPWPPAEQLAAMVDTHARQVASQEGITLPGAWRILARRAGPYLDVARALDWAEGAPLVLGAEVEGRVEVDTPLGPRRIRFRADRVDRSPAGRLLVTDYKTGRPLSGARRAETRDRHHLGQVASGARLQATVYALAEEGAEGRYLFLRPDGVDPTDACRDARAPGVTIPWTEYRAALDRVTDTALRGWEHGGLVPRLVTPDGDPGPACATCALRTACLQGDSTARLRLLQWGAGEDPPSDPAQQAALDLWRLGAEEGQ